MPRGIGCSTSGDRAERGRKKKLTVAFHFQFAKQAAWECDSCRRNGLVEKRRCGLLGLAPDGVIWARKQIAIGTCPKSYVSAESVGLLEEFLVRRQLGGSRCEELSARKAEAFVVLERELEREQTGR